MKKYIVIAEVNDIYEQFMIEAKNQNDAAKVGRQVCRREGGRYVKVKVYREVDQRVPNYRKL